MKQLSTIDIHYLENELKALETSRVDKIYVHGKEELYLQVHKSGIGRLLLKVLLGKALFLVSSKESTEVPSEFCMLLRKHLEGLTIVSLEQLKPERIIKMELVGKGTTKTLYLEFYGKGNIVLCEKDIILDAFSRQRFRDRAIIPKHMYSINRMKNNIFSLAAAEFHSILCSSQKNTLVTAIALDIGIGGKYAEELCILAKQDKAQKPTSLSEKSSDELFESLQGMMKMPLHPKVWYEDDIAFDATPFGFISYTDKKCRRYDTFSQALEEYYRHQHSARKPNAYDLQIQELRRIIHEQEERIQFLAIQEQDFRSYGEMIYLHYTKLQGLLLELKEQSKKESLQSLAEAMKERNIIINPKNKTFSVTIENP